MIAAVILAAGASVRMGRLKQLLPFGSETLLGTTLTQVCGSRVDDVLVVLGHEADAIRAALTPLVARGGRPVRFVLNPDYRAGMSTSLKTGVEALPPDTEAFILVLGDQPLIRPGTMDLLMAGFRRGGASIIVPTYGGRRGHPVLFSLALRDELLAIAGDVGARAVVERDPARVREIPVDDPGVLADIDTAADYEQALPGAGR